MSSPRVLLIILDGCRPDAIEKADAPHLESLWRGGAYTWSARTVMPCITLPAHVSMFRGVSPELHGCGSDNVYQPGASDFPSILELAHEAGLHTAMFHSWGPLRDLAAPGKLRMSHCREAIYGQDNDTSVARAAAAYLVAEQPDFAVLYFGDVDITGHLHGAGVKRGHRVAAPVDIRDTASTIAHLLGIAPAPSWEGRPVLDALVAPGGAALPG